MRNTDTPVCQLKAHALAVLAAITSQKPRRPPFEFLRTSMQHHRRINDDERMKAAVALREPLRAEHDGTRTTGSDSSSSNRSRKRDGRKRRWLCTKALQPLCCAIVCQTLDRALADDSDDDRSTLDSAMAAVAANAKAIKAIQKLLASTSPRPSRASVDLFLQLPDVKVHSAAYLDAILRVGYKQQTFALTEVLRFLRGLPNPDHQLNGCWILHQVDASLATSDHRQHSFALAFFVYELKQKLQNSPLKIRVDQFWHEWYTPGVRALVLGHSVTLHAFASATAILSASPSSAATEVLCAAPDALKFDSQRRRVFTATAPSSPSQDAASAIDSASDGNDDAARLATQWRFVPGNDAKTWFYLVSAHHTTEYVYAAMVKVDDPDTALAKDYAFMWCGGAPDAQCEWELRACGGRDVFELYNVDRQAYLFAAPDRHFDSERRFVLALDRGDATSEHADARKWRVTT